MPFASQESILGGYAAVADVANAPSVVLRIKV